MLEIVQDVKEIFEASNSIIHFKFYKIGENQGKYDVNYTKDISYSLKDCYSSINFFSPNSENLSEYTSKNYSFENRVENIEDIFGKGINVIFYPLDIEEIGIYFEISFKIYENLEFILIKLIKIKDNNQNPLRVHSISPLTIKNSNFWLSGTHNPTSLNELTWFKHGFQGWSPCELLFGKERDIKGYSSEILNIMFDNQDYKIEGRFYSEYCTVITDFDSKNSLILGFISFKDQFSRIILDYKDPHKIELLTAFGCMDGIKFNESSINSSEELYISFKSKNLGYYGLLEYARVVKAKIEEERITNIPIGWGSWYHYYENITEKDIIQNLEFFKNNQDSLPIDIIQLDGGYYNEIGDYNEMNSQFPSGLDELFKKIKNSGFKSGIWAAPFFAVRRSNIFKRQKDWFLKRLGSNKLLKTSFNWNTFEYSLDLSNNDVIEYLKNFFSSFLFAFKNENIQNSIPLIDFFKLDFLYAGVPIEGDFKDKTLTRAQLYYNGMKAIRDGITDKSFLLGCGAPLGPCVGLVDGMRISYDTAPQWEAGYLEKIENRRGLSLPALKVALLDVLYRSFMHKYFWINDPDCLMIRRTDTKLNIDEIRLQVTLCGLSGGQILISDDMTKLSKDEINDSKLVIPPYNPKDYDPILVDAFVSKLPSIYMLETRAAIGKRFLVAIVNWEDTPINRSISVSEMIPTLSIEENEFYVYDFWNRKFLGEVRRDDIIELKNFNPHSCNYLSIIPFYTDTMKIPILLSTDLHISQGCCEIKNFTFNTRENKVLIDLELIGQREGFLYLKLPKNKSILNYNFRFLNIDNKNNIWELYVEFNDQITLEVELLNQ